MGPTCVCERESYRKLEQGRKKATRAHVVGGEWWRGNSSEGQKWVAETQGFLLVVVTWLEKHSGGGGGSSRSTTASMVQWRLKRKGGSTGMATAWGTWRTSSGRPESGQNDGEVEVAGDE